MMARRAKQMRDVIERIRRSPSAEASSERAIEDIIHQVRQERRSMTAIELVSEKRDDILRLAASYGATNVRVFGSTARGEETQSSDIDFLVTMEPGRSLLDKAGLLDDLQQLLGRKVDVVVDDAIYWLLRRRILKEARPV